MPDILPIFLFLLYLGIELRLAAKCLLNPPSYKKIMLFKGRFLDSSNSHHYLSYLSAKTVTKLLPNQNRFNFYIWDHNLGSTSTSTSKHALNLILNSDGAVIQA